MSTLFSLTSKYTSKHQSCSVIKGMEDVGPSKSGISELYHPNINLFMLRSGCTIKHYWIAVRKGWKDVGLTKAGFLEGKIAFVIFISSTNQPVVSKIQVTQININYLGFCLFVCLFFVLFCFLFCFCFVLFCFFFANKGKEDAELTITGFPEGHMSFVIYIDHQ